MTTTAAQQVSLDNALVPLEKRVEIGKCNMRIDPTKTWKEPTYQVFLDALAVTTCYPAFLIIADVPEIYMQQFWFTINKKDSTSYQFKIDKKRILGPMRFVSKFEDFRVYGALLPSRMTNQEMRDSTACKTYLTYATGVASPKMKRKFKKPASLLIKRTLVTVELEEPEPAKKVKAPAKAERSKGIELLSDTALLEEAQLKKDLKRSKQETNIHQAGGSSKGANLKLKVSDEPKGKSIDTSEGIGLKPVVPDVSKADYSKSEYKSYGDNYVLTDDEMNDESNDVTEEECERSNEELYGDVNVTLTNTKPADKGKDDEEMTVVGLVNVNQKGAVKTSTTVVPDSETLAALQLRVTDLEKDVKKLKDVDNFTKLISTIKSKVPNAVKEYLGSSMDDALHKELLKKLKKRKPNDSNKDKGPFAGLDRGLKRQITRKHTQKSKKAKSTESSKGTSKSQPKSTSRSSQAEETVFMGEDTQGPQNLGEDTGNTDEPPVVNVDPKDWFKKPERRPTLDPEWNKGKLVENKPTQKWLSDLEKAEKPSRTFDDLMSTLIDFSAFVKNHLQIKCYKELTDQLDWNNPEGNRYPFDLSKPLPLVMSGNCKIVPVDYFFNNDLAYLQGGSTRRTYTTSLTKKKAAKYDLPGIEDMSFVCMANCLTTDSTNDGNFKKKVNAINKKRSNDHNKNRGRDDKNKRQRTGRNFVLTAPKQDRGNVSMLVNIRSVQNATSIILETALCVEPSYNQNYHDNYYPHDLPSFPCCDNCGESHETFQCQPMDQNINFSGSDQIQTPQYPNVHASSQEISDEVFHAKGDLIKSIQTFLEEFNYIPFGEKPKILLEAWYNFFTIRHAQPEDSNKLFQKLLEDLKELAEYVNSPSRDRSNFLNNNEDHSVQNHSNEIATSNSNQEKEGPPQNSDIHQLIREECSIEVYEEQKQKMEDTTLELVEIFRQKELLCMHDNVDDLIESALNSKLLSINYQRLNKEKQEVKNVVEQPAERRTLIIKSLQNFRVIRKSSISLKNTSQISPVHAVAPILSTKEPEYSSSMGYENSNTTLKTESDEIKKSGVEELVPILSENEVTLKEKKECYVPVCENSPICDDHFEIFFDSNNDDDISSDDNNFEDIEYVEASLSDPEIVSVAEENVVYQEAMNRLIANIESLNDNATPNLVLNSSVSFPISEESDNSLSDIFSPEFETFGNHTKETRSGDTTTHANDSLPEYDLFCFEIKPDQERLINVVKNDIPDDSTNDPLLEESDLFLASDNLIPPSSESDFDNPLVPRPPPEQPDADFEPDYGNEILVVMNNNDKLECLNPSDEFYDDD
nr:hypothetical protein [Tanacetum cinerariifolium]